MAMLYVVPIECERMIMITLYKIQGFFATCTFVAGPNMQWINKVQIFEKIAFGKRA